MREQRSQLTSVVSTSHVVMNINELGPVCLENVLIYLSPYDDLYHCKQVCRLWHFVAHETVKRLNREFRRSLLSHDLVAHAFEAKRNEITPRYSHSSCVFEGHLYVFGGSTKERNLFNDLWTFCLSKKTWNRPQTVGLYPSPKARASLLVFQRRLILFGGQSVHRYAFGRESWKLFSEVYQFDVDQANWTLIPAVNPGPSVSSHSACLSGHRMLIFGGLMLADNRSLVCSNELWTFDLKSYEWTQIPSPSPRPCPRFGHSLIALDEHHFLLLGGCSDQSFSLNDVWILKLMGQTAIWTTIIVRQTDAIPFQPKLHLNPVCKVSDDLVMVLNFKQTPGHGAKSRSCGNNAVPSHDNEPQRSSENVRGRGAVCFPFLDISTVLNYGYVTWKQSLNRSIPGPDSVMLYTLHLTKNEILLFGGMTAPENPSPGTAGDHFPHVSNKLHIISSRKEVT